MAYTAMGPEECKLIEKQIECVERHLVSLKQIVRQDLAGQSDTSPFKVSTWVEGHIESLYTLTQSIGDSLREVIARHEIGAGSRPLDLDSVGNRLPQVWAWIEMIRNSVLQSGPISDYQIVSPLLSSALQEDLVILSDTITNASADLTTLGDFVSSYAEALKTNPKLNTIWDYTLAIGPLFHLCRFHVDSMIQVINWHTSNSNELSKLTAKKEQKFASETKPSEIAPPKSPLQRVLEDAKFQDGLVTLAVNDRNVVIGGIIDGQLALDRVPLGEAFEKKYKAPASYRDQCFDSLQKQGVIADINTGKKYKQKKFNGKEGVRMWLMKVSNPSNLSSVREELAKLSEIP